MIQVQATDFVQVIGIGWVSRILPWTTLAIDGTPTNHFVLKLGKPFWSVVSVCILDKGRPA
jgi:hypothetical protein